MSWIFILVLIGQTVYDLDTVVVTATRYPSPLKDVAQAVLVLDRGDIEARKASSLAEVLRDQAGIDIKEYGVAGSFAGINLRGVPSTAVVVMVDGQPVNSILSGAADLSSIELGEVERIEIVRGPASSLYGANALGGVVNVITRNRYERFAYRGQTGTNAAVEPEISTLRQYHVSKSGISPLPKPTVSSSNNFFLEAGTPIGSFEAGANFGLEQADGSRSNSAMKGYSGRGSVGYFGVPIEVSLAFKYHQKEYGVPGPSPLVDNLHPSPLFGDSFASSIADHEKDRDFSGRLDINWEIAPRLKLQSLISGNDMTIDYHTAYLGYNDWIIEDYLWRTMTAVYNLSIIRQFGSTDLILGLDARYDSLVADRTSLDTGDTTWYAGQSNAGAWCEAKSRLGPFVFNPSLRLDRNSGCGYFFSPQVGVVYAATPDLRMTCSFGRAFRQPGFNDLYSPLYGNPDLKPEAGNSAELRAELGNANATFSALSLFIRDINDRIAWLPTQGGMWRPQNVNRLAIRGVEWETRYNHRDRVKVANQITYLNGLQTNRELINADGTTRDATREAAFVPPLALSSRWEVKLPVGLVLDLEGSYTSARKNYYENWSRYPVITMDTKVLREFVVFNAGLTRAFGRVSASIGVKNMLDAKYATQFGNTVDDLDYPMPPRTYYFKMALE